MTIPELNGSKKWIGGATGGGALIAVLVFGANAVETRFSHFEATVAKHGDRIAICESLQAMNRDRIGRIEASPPAATSIATQPKLDEINRRLDRIERRLERGQ